MDQWQNKCCFTRGCFRNHGFFDLGGPVNKAAYAFCVAAMAEEF
ncbi:MAG: hypothetical protein ACLRQF_01480 [Thomasclavelia ramosa]